MAADPIRCPACDAPLSADRVDFRRGLTACDHCGVVSKLDEFAMPPAGEPGGERSAKTSPPATRPEGWTVSEHGGAVAVRWRWWSVKYLFTLVFGIAWNAFLVVWYGGILGIAGGAVNAGGGFVFGAFGVGMALFGLPFVAVGVGLIYGTAAGFLNRTTVTAGHGEVRVRHAPLPWRGTGSHDAAGFTRLFVREQISRGEDSTTVTHDLLAATEDGGEVALVRGFEAANEARFLGETLGRALGVPEA